MKYLSSLLIIIYVTKDFNHAKYLLFLLIKMTTKQLYIKNRTYYFYNDLINLSNFSMNNLKLDKKNMERHLYLLYWLFCQK